MDLIDPLTRPFSVADEIKRIDQRRREILNNTNIIDQLIHDHLASSENRNGGIWLLVLFSMLLGAACFGTGAVLVMMSSG